jgi:protein-disulfide isomerase
MMAVRGQMNEDMVLATAKETGLDLDKLQKDMQAPEIDAIIARNKKLAQGIGIEGTPNFIVGDTVVPGAVDISYIKELVEKAR